MVRGESNEIKIVHLSWESEKRLIIKKNLSPPHISNGPPLRRGVTYIHTYIHYEILNSVYNIPSQTIHDG